MALVCQNPSCFHEFDDAVGWDEHEANDAGEVPYLTHVYIPDDGPGIATDYLCSAECMVEYLDEVVGTGGGA